MTTGQTDAGAVVPSGNLLADPSVIALIRLPVGVSTLVTLGHPLEQMARRKGGEAMMRQEGEWLVITANRGMSLTPHSKQPGVNT